MNIAPFDLTTSIALTGMALLISATLLRILYFFNSSKRLAYSLVFIVLLVSLMTIFDTSMIIYCRAIVSDLSITSLLLLSYYIVNPEHDSSKKENKPIFYLLVISSLFFYPAALGLSMIDPYSWGFINNTQHPLQNIFVIACLALLMIFAFIKHYSRLLLCLVLCLFAYQLKLLASQNIWDYYFDPLVFFYALYTLLRHSIRLKRPITLKHSTKVQSLKALS